MVTIALLSFIVLGLLAMFNQTQRAFRSSMTQVDVLEAGRAVTDMIARDIEQMIASEMPDLNGTNGFGCTNFFAELTPLMTQGVLQGMPGTSLPSGAQECRKNVFYDVFFLARQNLDYMGIGYHVEPDSGSPIVGTLYRFMTNRPKSAFIGPTATGLSLEFRQATVPLPRAAAVGPLTNMSRIADGVVHFSIRAFDTNGIAFTYIDTNPKFGMFRTNGYVESSAIGAKYAIMHNSRVTVPYPATLPDQFNYYFFSNAVPAYLELEVGFLEPHILDRLKGIGNGNPAAQYAYLSNHTANVHLFRRRIPIRNVDFLAYQ
jgi:hypothetical protein